MSFEEEMVSLSFNLNGFLIFSFYERIVLLIKQLIRKLFDYKIFNFHLSKTLYLLIQFEFISENSILKEFYIIKSLFVTLGKPISKLDKSF